MNSYALVHLLIIFIFQDSWKLRIEFWFDIPKPGKLIKMPSECISRIFKGLVSTTNKTSSFYHVMSTIKSWCCEVLINRMNLEVLEWIHRCWTVLPDITDDIIEAFVLEIIDRTRGKPILGIYISNLSTLPFKMIFIQILSNLVILIFRW